MRPIDEVREVFLATKIDPSEKVVGLADGVVERVKLSIEKAENAPVMELQLPLYGALDDLKYDVAAVLRGYGFQVEVRGSVMALKGWT